MEKQSQINGEGKTALNHAAFYSFSLYSRMFFSLLGGILIAKLLGPALYGIRNAFGLAMEYDAYSNMGSFAAMSREVPYYRGGKDIDKAELIVSTTFGVNFLFSLFIGITLICVSLYLRTTSFQPIYIDFVFFLGLLTISNKVMNFYADKLLIDKKFILTSRVQMLYGIVNCIACVTLAYYIGLRGVFIGLVISDVVCIGYILINERRIPAIRISIPVIIELVKIGFPIMIVGLLLMILKSTDRIIIIAMLSKEDLGYFGIAVFTTFIIATIPSAIIDIVFPGLMEKLGRTKDIYQIKHYFIELTVLIAYFMPFLLAVLYFSIHIPVQYYLTDYLPAINVVKIITAGLFFNALYMIPIGVCYAIDKQVKIIYIALPAVVLNFILNYLFIRLGWGINGVALGTSISYFIFCSAIVWYTLKQFKDNIGNIYKYFLMIYSPFIYSLLLIIGLENLLLFNSMDIWNDMAITSIKILLFFLLYSLIFILVRKHSAFIRLIDHLPFNPFNKRQKC